MSSFLIGNYSFANQVNILFGNKCNASCDFCTNHSSPLGKTRLSIQSIADVIVQASEIGFQSVGFSGGEPFLYRDTLNHATSLCEELGLAFVIATNGFWAKTPELAYSALAALMDKGLRKLQLSYDAEHARFVMPHKIDQILVAAEKLGLPVILYSAYGPEDARIDELVNFRAYANVTVDEGPALNVGRARRHKRYHNVDSAHRVGACPPILQITVNFDGDIYPCCSVGGFSKHLCLGNISSTPLRTAINNILSNPVILFLQVGVNTDDVISMARNFTGSSYSSICELCHDIHSNELLFEKLRCQAEIYLVDAIAKLTSAKRH